MDVFDGSAQDHLATFDGNSMIVTPEKSFRHTDTELSALDRARYLQLSKEQKALEEKRKEKEDALKALGKEAASEEGEALVQEIQDLRTEIAAKMTEMKDCLTWNVACKYPYSLVLADGVLFAGGTNEVAAIGSEHGEILWTSPVEGRALDLAPIDGRLLVSTDQGKIYCFSSVK